MGCEYCDKSIDEKCTASRSFRANFCQVALPGEREFGGGSNYTPPKKRKHKEKPKTKHKKRKR